MIANELESGNNLSSISLLSTGSVFTKFLIDGVKSVDMGWDVIGHNQSVPAYIKYRRELSGGYNHVYVASTKKGLLA